MILAWTFQPKIVRGNVLTNLNFAKIFLEKLLNFIEDFRKKILVGNYLRITAVLLAIAVDKFKNCLHMSFFLSPYMMHFALENATDVFLS